VDTGNPETAVPPDRGAACTELAAVFLKLGTTAFGGPAAHIAMMEEEVVRRRRWLSHEQFLDLLGATYVIPGPNSTEMAIHIGYLRAGWAGLLVAGGCFIIPAAVMVACIAAAYTRLGTLPISIGLLAGLKPVVIAIVAHALWQLGRTAVKTPGLALVAAGATGLTLAGTNELVVLLLAAGVMVGVQTLGTRRSRAAVWNAVPLMPLASSVPAAAAAAATPFGLWPLFLVFVKIGAVLFGSGYVLLAFLRADLVHRLGWLTEAQLLDATAVGQITPGPLFTTATFIGYILGGTAGAVVATVGIFLPAFGFVALSGPLVPRLRQSPTTAAVLDGVNVGALALMAVVTWQLAQAALVDGVAVLLALASAALLFGARVNSAWLILGGALVGMLRGR